MWLSMMAAKTLDSSRFVHADDGSVISEGSTAHQLPTISAQCEDDPRPSSEANQISGKPSPQHNPTQTTSTQQVKSGSSNRFSIPMKFLHRRRAGEKGAPITWNTLHIDPNLPSHYNWLAIVSLAVFYNLLFIIGRSVFWELNNCLTVFWWLLDYTCDGIYIVDTVIHAHEGYLDQGMMVKNSTKLRENYVISKKWICDLLSLLPTDLVYLVYPSTSCPSMVPCPVVSRLNRLFRLPRMLEFFDRTETRTEYPNTFRICKVVFATLVLIHWNACFYFAISYFIGFDSDNWVYNLNGQKNSTLSRQYIYSFYWSTLTLTTIGETPQPENDAEYLFVVIDLLAGVLIFATIVGNIGSMISNMNVARLEFQKNMDAVKQYMSFRRVSKELEARVIRWFSYTWANKGAFDEYRVFGALPDKLKAELAIHIHLDTLKQVSIFEGCEPGLLEELVLKLRLQVFSPGEFVCRKGDIGREMYIVKRGRLSVVPDDESTVILATLSAGDVFGEVSVLDIPGNKTDNRRTANVRSIGYSDVFYLAKDDLWTVLTNYPDARKSLMERGCQILRKDGLLNEEVYSRSQQQNEGLEQKVQRIETTVEILEMRYARLKADMVRYQSSVKQRLSKMERRGIPQEGNRHRRLSLGEPRPRRESPSGSTRCSFQGVPPDYWRRRRRKPQTL